MNKTALMISIALTAFALIIVATVFSAVKAPYTATAASVTDTVTPEATVIVDAQLEQAIANREAAYQDLINQANNRLDALQQENQALKEQLNTVQTGLQQPAASVGIPPEAAALVAANWMGDGQIYSVEGTTIDGQSVYKVTFSSGAIVYVSLDGQVIGSQAPAAALNVANGGFQRGGENEHEEHEGDND